MHSIFSFFRAGRRVVILLCALLACAVAEAPAADGAGQKPLVFIVHSYGQGDVCGQPQADGVLESLEEAGLYPEQVEVTEFFMDTKRSHVTAEAIAAQGRLALERVASLQPKVVVTLDDNAFRHVGLPLLDRPGVAVVFSGMNGQPEDYDNEAEFMDSRQRPGHNITGVYEKLHLQHALKVLHTTLPEVRKVVGITDASPTGHALLRQFELEAAEGLPVAWEVHQVETFDAYQQLILALNDDSGAGAIYPVALTLTHGEEQVTAPEIFRWTLQHSRKPEIALNYFFSELGLFGGASVDFQSMGRHAGVQVAAILQGTAPGDIPIIEAPDYAIVFNVKRAEMLGLAIPEDILLASDAVYDTIKLFEQ
jgi:hypothetical protein